MVETPQVPADDTADETAAPPRGTGPEAARAELARCIAAKEQGAVDLIATEAKIARANDVLFQGITDEDAASRLLTGAKSHSLMNSGMDWRESPAVTDAQASVQDAQERTALARTALASLEEERERLLRVAGWSDHHIRHAVRSVVQSHSGLQAIVAEAHERRRAWHESQQLIGALENYFGPPCRLPGFEAIYHEERHPRVQAWRQAIARMHEDAEVAFPP